MERNKQKLGIIIISTVSIFSRYYIKGTPKVFSNWGIGDWLLLIVGISGDT